MDRQSLKRCDIKLEKKRLWRDSGTLIKSPLGIYFLPAGKLFDVSPKAREPTEGTANYPPGWSADNKGSYSEIIKLSEASLLSGTTNGMFFFASRFNCSNIEADNKITGERTQRSGWSSHIIFKDTRLFNQASEWYGAHKFTKRCISFINARAREIFPARRSRENYSSSPGLLINLPFASLRAEISFERDAQPRLRPTTD